MVAAPCRGLWRGELKKFFPFSWQGHSSRPPIFLEEQKRIEKNKETKFVCLIEEERRAEAENDFPDVNAQLEAGARRAEEAQHEAEARRTRESETA